MKSEMIYPVTKQSCPCLLVIKGTLTIVLINKISPNGYAKGLIIHTSMNHSIGTEVEYDMNELDKFEGKVVLSN